jgi:hypothetical protein
MGKIVVGTRGSNLAQWRTNHIVSALKRVAPDLPVQMRVIRTTGDKDKTTPLAQLGGSDVFTKEIEAATTPVFWRDPKLKHWRLPLILQSAAEPRRDGRERKR